MGSNTKPLSMRWNPLECPHRPHDRNKGMILKPIEQISKSDIDALVTQDVREGILLEYKLTLPGKSDSDKKEFVADVCALANTSGGDLIYGIEEKRENGRPTGIPKAAPGISTSNSEIELQRLNNLVLNGTDPQLTGIRITAIEGFLTGPVIILRVPKSWASPHRVKLSESRFFMRNDTGKYPMSTSMIRKAIESTGMLAEKVKQFREQRILDIYKRETPVPLESGGKLVLHLIPAAFQDPSSYIDITSLAGRPHTVQPLNSSGVLGGWSHRYNIDGFMTYCAQGPFSSSYVQLFRSGIIEATDCYLMKSIDTDQRLLPHVEVENELIQGLKKYLDLYQVLSVRPPVFLLATLVDAKGYKSNFHKRDFMSPYAIDRDTVRLPDILLEDFSTRADHVLRPVFDGMWQATGMPCCRHYDEKGDWNPDRRQ